MNCDWNVFLPSAPTTLLNTSIFLINVFIAVHSHNIFNELKVNIFQKVALASENVR